MHRGSSRERVRRGILDHRAVRGGVRDKRAVVPAAASAKSSITVLLKDSPFSDAKALLVTFSELQVHASGDSWMTVPFASGASSRTCDLKKLETAQDILGVGSLPAGHYTQLRLVVSSATI